MWGYRKNKFIADVVAMSKAYSTKTIIKERIMKNKKFYHTFMVKEREVTLCLFTKETLFGPCKVQIGYSVRVASDDPIEGLSKKIALGRAKKSPIKGGSIDSMFWDDNGVLKGVAFHWERKFKDNISEYVKGVR